MLAKFSARDRYTIKVVMFNFFAFGVAAILIGAFLPQMREEYSLSYSFGGALVSAFNAGNLLIGLVTGILAVKFGKKRSYMVMTFFIALGFLGMLLTKNPVLLLISFAVAGIGRGAGPNYGNGVVNEMTKDSSAILNLINALFAVGALLAPILMLGCEQISSLGWRLAVLLVVILGAASGLSMIPMKLTETSESGNVSMAFLKLPLFWLTVAFAFCYMSTEASVIGWMVTFFTESGVADASMSLLLNCIFWGAVLIGRILCTKLAVRMAPPKMLTMLSAGMLISFGGLMLSHSLAVMLIFTVLFGLSVSGMYATAIANTGDICRQYPMALGFFTSIAGIGGIITPSVIGILADISGIRSGMLLLLAPLALQLVFVLLNLYRSRTR